MAVRDADRLRQMVNDYYHGLLTEDSYREQRAGLLDNLGVDVPDREDTITRAQAPVPVVDLPPMLRVPMDFAELRFPVPHPGVEIRVQLARGRKEVQMIRQDHVPPDAPGDRPPPDRHQTGVAFFRGQPTTAMAGADG